MRHHIYLAIGLIFIAGSCKNGCRGSRTDKPDSQDTSAVQISDYNDPRELRKLDSIPLPALADTAGMDETATDSLRFAWLFQKEANRLGRAELARDYAALASFAPEGVLKRFGGKDAYISRLKAADAERTAYTKVLNGPVKRVAPAVDEQGYSSAWYCLMPVRAYRMQDGKEVVDMMWLGGQASLNGGKAVFLNITSLSREQILQVMPDLRFVLDNEAGQP